ncbi:MAG: Asp-tRNA(Asn)/Glu-tRNA(Gln) amidotransferase subunit GatB, partial [bacterium]|nr:Asp-tRNA(Asn)/Glu-tRNA(Gln) amidotransferase subunit GatB [bacterium]
MNRYIPVIGMEIHVELKTKSKMFCGCKNGLGLEIEPNVNICPVCTAQPGTLPVANGQAVRFVQMAGLALDCRIAENSKFDRKNYFYPDIPKGYQISQYDQPLCEHGRIEIDGKTVGITRIHMEEDTGKLVHPKGADHSLVDFNRAGVPLMELVTEPDIENGKEARLFCQKLQQIFRYLEISEADMEKGHMRCEVNISLHKEGEEKLSGTKSEIKNLNSFRTVEKAVD